MRIVKLLGILSTVSVLLLQACDPEELDPCRQPRFTLEENDDPNRIVAVADLNGIEGAYQWYINDDLVDGKNSNTDREHILDIELVKAGTYRICLVIETEECDERLEFCLEVTIEKDSDKKCFEPEFTIQETDRPDLFKFLADFDGIDTLVYDWYVGDQLVETEELNDKRDNKLIWDFEPGTYEICLAVRSEVCEDNRVFCRELVVEAPQCPQLSFTATEDPERVYLFKADFEDREEVKYKWYVNDELVDKENFEGHDTDHQLLWDFEPGEYNVCIVALVDGCGDIEFCKEIIVEGPAGCPDLFFEADQISDRNYKFVADFEGINELNWYGWFINGEEVENEGTMNNGDNKLDYVFTEEGTYEICIMTETPECPQGVEFCKTIEVKFNICKELSFVAEQVPNTPGYTFTADFEGRDDVTYIWSVYINGDYQGGEVREAGSADDHEFYWQFAQGTSYTVCLRQDGQECANYQVCKEILIN